MGVKILRDKKEKFVGKTGKRMMLWLLTAALTSGVWSMAGCGQGGVDSSGDGSNVSGGETGGKEDGGTEAVS